MSEILTPTKISIDNHILRTLSYFDIFSYPLNEEELRTFLGCEIETEELNSELEKLVNKRIIFKTVNFYSIQDIKWLAQRRLKGNSEAERLFPLAVEKAKEIFSFPYIRAIMVSGSLSKNYMDEKSDLDFFVITEKNRLWIARTIFDIYRKFFIRKENFKHYCTNYHISLERLNIDEENIFTATELCTLIPIIGEKHYVELMQSNTWIQNYFPNLRLNPANTIIIKNPLKKQILESIINFFLPNLVDKLFQFVRVTWIKIKFKKNYSEIDFSIAFKSKSYVSKAHDKHGQKRILNLYQANLEKFKLL